MAERKTYTAEDFKGCNGRRVLVEAVLVDRPVGVLAGCVGATLAGRHYGIPVSAIVEILPEEIKEGDRVKPARGASERAFGDGSIIAISGPRAWVECSRGWHHFALLSDLTLVERGQ